MLIEDDKMWMVVGLLDSGVVEVRRDNHPGRRFSRTIWVTSVGSQAVSLQQDRAAILLIIRLRPPERTLCYPGMKMTPGLFGLKIFLDVLAGSMIVSASTLLSPVRMSLHI